MSGEIEAAGAAVTAGLAAATLDNHQSRKGHAHGPCPNCATELTGEYCANCGQPAHIHRTLGHMVEEFLHGILHFDTRAWRTLPLLAFRPGTLTHGYIHGQRARFISPLAIFLLTVFTMFFVFSFLGPPQIDFNEADASASIEESREGIDKLRPELADAEAALASATAALQAIPASAPADDPLREAAQDKVAEAKQLVDEKALELRLAEEALAILERTVAAAAPAPGVAGETRTAQVTGLDQLYDRIAEAARNGEIKVNTGFKSIDKKILEKLSNPELALYKIQNTAYKFSFLLVPISLPFMWLLFFWKRGVTLFDHAVVILYSLSFVSLLFVLGALVALSPFDLMFPFVLIAVFGLPLHLYFQLKGAYALGWFSALWRTAILLIICTFTLSLFLLAIILLGLTG